MRQKIAEIINQEIDELVPLLTSNEHTKEEVFHLISLYALHTSKFYGKNQIIPFLAGALHAHGYAMSQRKKMIRGNTYIVYKFLPFVYFKPTLVDGFNF